MLRSPGRPLTLAVLPWMVVAAFAASPSRAQTHGASAVHADEGALAGGTNAFAFELYHQLGRTPGNVAFAPGSLAMALGMTHAGARGETAAQIARVMHFTVDGSRLNTAFATLRHGWQTAPGARWELDVADRLWGARSEPFAPAYLAVTRDAFGAQLATMDFAHAAEPARLEINQWVAQRTHDHITDLLPPDSVDATTRMVLTDAVYFKAHWVDAFAPAETHPGAFHVDATHAPSVPMMHRTGTYATATVPGGRMLMLPYAGDAFEMDVLLPDAPDGLPALEARLTADSLRTWVAATQSGPLSVALPRFHVRARTALRDVLSTMGMPRAFTAEADFTGMAPRGGIQLSQVFHQALIDVDEEGTVATAATAVVAVRGMGPMHARFEADHPFVYLVRDVRTGTVLFVGRVVDPAGA